MKAAGASETLMVIYQTTRRHISETTSQSQPCEPCITEGISFVRRHPDRCDDACDTGCSIRGRKSVFDSVHGV